MASVQVQGFYAVVDLLEGPLPELLARARDLAAALVGGGASLVQLRMKRASTRSLLAVAEALREMTAVPFVVNDRLDVALAVGADAVHLGQDDLPLAAARAALARAGRRLLIGVSTHTPAQAEAAARAGADYLGFGPVFPTVTKENPDPVQGAAALAEAVRRAAPVPVVAIGGISVANVAEVRAAGAAAACAIGAVNNARDIRAAAAAMSATFKGEP
jgi:thiamine-phosphate pyrophosphorylase